MGTSGSYSGSGGKIGDGIREGVGDWINSLPPDGPPPDGNDDHDGGPEQPKLDPALLLPAVGLFRPRSRGGGADGPGGGGGRGGADTPATTGGRRSGGPTRSVGGSATSAGRAAAGAYAYRAGDAATLSRLGLDYAELSALGDQFEITRRIVEAACGPRADSTIEDHEQRLVAADVAEWVLSQDIDGGAPSPEEIVRHTISLVIADAVLTETGEIVSSSNNADLAESEIRDAAEALAAREDLSADGVTEDQFTEAIARGIETLRGIVGGKA